jgi:hypothetical protein
MPSIGQTWVLASIGAVVEMGIEYIEMTAYGVYQTACTQLGAAVNNVRTGFEGIFLSMLTKMDYCPTNCIKN